MASMNQSIKELDLESTTLNKLLSNNVNTVKDLWKLKRSDLKDFDLNNDEVNQIIIKMQLYGIDLNKKVYDKK